MISILCIDDEAITRELILHALCAAGFTTFQAANGREGLEVMKAKWPDIVISDIAMPEMDGRELLAEIRMNEPGLAAIPFIFLTSLEDRETMLDGLRAGVEDYLNKPVDLDLLMARIDGCVAKIENARQTGRIF